MERGTLPFWSMTGVHLKGLWRSKTNVVSMLLSPLFFGLLILLMARGASAEHRAAAVIGAALMGFWTVVIFGSAQVFHDMRRNGLLEIVVAAPMSLLRAALPQTLVTNLVGVLDFLLVAALGQYVLGSPLTAENWPYLAAHLIVCLFALTAMGVCLSVFFIVARDVYAWTNVMEFPLWILSGLSGAQVQLPWVLDLLSRLLPTRWTMEAAASAMDGGPGAAPLIAAFVLGCCYLAAAVPLVRAMQNTARRKGTLSLV